MSFDEHAESMSLCSSCPSLCQSACPVHMQTGNKSHSPWGMMQILQRIQRKEMPLDAESAEISFRCTTCRACIEQCDHEVPIPDILATVRAKSVKDGLAPEAIRGFVEKYHRHNNPFSKDLLQKLKTLVPEKWLNRDFSVVYYASCTTIAKTPEVVRDTFALFEKLKIDFVGVYADPIQCCGYPLFSAGAQYEFVDAAEINYHSLKKHRLIIVGSPTCAYTLKETYARFDFDISDKIVTINEFLWPYLKNINFKVNRGLRTKLMYHDPCYSSRYLKEGELPRDMIGLVTGTPPVEFIDNREKSACSGQGGCYSVLDKESADDITRKRVSETYEKKINTVVTQCPSCVHKMRQNSKGLVIKDLVSYLNDAIQGASDG